MSNNEDNADVVETQLNLALKILRVKKQDFEANPSEQTAMEYDKAKKEAEFLVDKFDEVLH